MVGSKFLKQIKSAASTREDKLLLFYAIIVFFGGALRKWVIESSVVGNLVLMVQLIMPFLFLILGSPKAVSPFKQFPVLRVYFGYLIFHIFLPTQHTLFHGMLGVLIHGGFWVGVFYYFANRDKFFSPRLLPFFIIFSAIEIFLGFIQYTLPQDHILNKYALDTISQIAVVGDSVRITGTFSYISGYVSFLIFYPFIIWGLIRMHFSTWFITVAIAFGLFVSFMSGSRGGVGIYIIFLTVVIISLYNLKDIFRLAFQMLIPVAIMFGVLLVTNSQNFQARIVKAYENFDDRFQRGVETGEQQRRLLWDFYYFRDLNRYPNIIIGAGLGSMYQGSIILFGRSAAVNKFGFVEGELPKLVFEGGIVFMIFRIIMVTLVTRLFTFKHPLMQFLIWFSLVYFIPIGFQVYNASFMLMAIILMDNIAWRQQKKEMVKDGSTEEVEVNAPKLPAGYPQVFDKPLPV